MSNYQINPILRYLSLFPGARVVTKTTRKTPYNLKHFATLTAFLILMSTLHAQTADSEEPAWDKERRIRIANLTSKPESHGDGITPDNSERPSITPENCAGRPITILCVLGPVADPQVSDSCNETKTYLEKQGCDSVTIIVVNSAADREEIKQQLQDQEIIILDSHGTNENGSFESVDGAGTPVFTESDLLGLIPPASCFIANACHSGAIDAIDCELHINICHATVPISFQSAEEQLQNILPYVVAGIRPEGKMCTSIPTASAQGFIDDCTSKGGTYSNEGETPASHELTCRIKLKESSDGGCVEPAIEHRITIAGPEPTSAELAQCQQRALTGLECEIMEKRYSVRSSEAMTKACCNNTNLPGLPYTETHAPGHQGYVGISTFDYHSPGK